MGAEHPAQAPRYEIKLVAQDAAYDRVTMALRLDAAGLRPSFPTRRVQSLYLDTARNRALEENLAGISRRRKIRFRWYGEASENVRGRLECKVRENQLGWKHSAQLAQAVLVRGAERRLFVQRLAALAPGAWSIELLGVLEPAQWVSYRRDYYVSADGRVRVTVDRDLVSWDQRLRPFLACDVFGKTPCILVVEVKCREQHFDQAQALVRRLPLVVGRCSKFALASQTQHGPLPSLLPD